MIVCTVNIGRAIRFTKKNGNLVTPVDRKSPCPMARKSKTRTKIEVTNQLNKVLQQPVARTSTVDNGLELYWHCDVAEQSNVQVYFADPCASWQRGSNENVNVNGLLCRYYPKGFGFTTINAQQLRRTVEKINLLSRKILGWNSAHEVHYGLSVALIA
ncbi:Uncharacterised protein [BD1-7 clade bacterium]|uniref:Integrase catalytic domain-containing protein n=1 Tax=BD1-7 clade bacterium TaxID=2029982 RepID=A0A5S9NR67_9GAMM|nr:Uncharacterised protein [BD1-7 clade bacterium]CAA0092981.1 Uncharacterised protein [BD1-7 clade bacterium]